MKSLKHILLTMALSALFVGVQAQDNHRRQASDDKQQERKERAEQRRAETIAALELSKDQISQWDTIHEKYRSLKKQMRQESDGKREETKEQHQALRKAYEEDLKAILTKEQFAKWEELKEQRRQERKARQKKKSPPNTLPRR